MAASQILSVSECCSCITQFSDSLLNTIHYTKTICSRQTAYMIQWSVSQAICLDGIFPLPFAVVLSIILCRFAYKTLNASLLGKKSNFKLTFHCLCKISLIQKMYFFQNLLIVLENGYVAQITVNCFFLNFFVFSKQIQLL